MSVRYRLYTKDKNKFGGHWVEDVSDWSLEDRVSYLAALHDRVMILREEVEENGTEE